MICRTGRATEGRGVYSSKTYRTFAGAVMNIRQGPLEH